MKVFVVVTLLFSVCSAASLNAEERSGDSVQLSDQDQSASAEVKEEHVAGYTFDWAVKDGEAKLDFGHQETRDGDLTTGLYRVLLPNSVIHTVKYSVDGHSGYVAEVTNEEVEVKEEAVEQVGEENAGGDMVEDGRRLKVEGGRRKRKSHGKEEFKYYY